MLADKLFQTRTLVIKMCRQNEFAKMERRFPDWFAIFYMVNSLHKYTSYFLIRRINLVRTWMYFQQYFMFCFSQPNNRCIEVYDIN